MHCTPSVMTLADKKLTIAATRTRDCTAQRRLISRSDVRAGQATLIQQDADEYDPESIDFDSVKKCLHWKFGSGDEPANRCPRCHSHFYAATPVASHRRTYSPGDNPVMRRKVREKWL